MFYYIIISNIIIQYINTFVIIEKIIKELKLLIYLLTEIKFI